MEQKQEPVEIVFPIVYDKCPNCGHDERLAEMVANQEKAKGKLRPEAPAYIQVAQTVFADPTRLLLTVPVLMSCYDVCFKCGAYYCVRAEMTTARIGAPPPGDQKGFGFPQRFPGSS